MLGRLVTDTVRRFVEQKGVSIEKALADAASALDERDALRRRVVELEEALDAMYIEFGENFPDGESYAVDAARAALDKEME